ncbi:protein of unknown function [Paenibacillus alvei]|uniref:Uncharacterized protein n=1 Tax=Paenibacillus alvei TaxID=44250 RepID=A0A383RC93_PAEAL|nr:protein of unknown function [Paenibacillus alvei]
MKNFPLQKPPIYKTIKRAANNSGYGRNVAIYRTLPVETAQRLINLLFITFLHSRSLIGAALLLSIYEGNEKSMSKIKGK